MDGSRQPGDLTCEQARRWLYDRIDYERMRPETGQSNPFRLERTERLLTLIDSPQSRIPCIHIAGTKGKGSTAAMVESILRSNKRRTGLFTSPHIDTVEERMRIDGEIPSEREFANLVSRLNDLLSQRGSTNSEHIPTFFECTTLLAWMHFDWHKVDMAVLETGLGGRLDCTNVCQPLVTVISSIGLDHTHILGNTIQQIAAEKAGILKPGIPAVIGRLPPEAEQVVRSQAKRLGCPLYVAGQDFLTERVAPRNDMPGDQQAGEEFTYRSPDGRSFTANIPLRGQHQVDNASLAIMAVQLLEPRFGHITTENIRNGLSRVHWPLRFEVMRHSPTIVLDAAHNPDSCEALIRTINEFRESADARLLIFGVSADKDAAAMLRILLPHFSGVVLTRFTGNPRGVPTTALQTLVREIGYNSDAVRTAEDPARAIETATSLAGDTGMICITGSLFLAAESRSILNSQPSPAALTSRV